MSEQPILAGEQLTDVTFKVRVEDAAAQQRAHDGAAVAGALQRLQEVQARLGLYGNGQDVLFVSREDWEALLGGLLAPAAFVAGSLQAKLLVWREWLKDSPGCKEALALVQHGFRLQFVAPASRQAMHHPEHEARIRAVHHLLQGQVRAGLAGSPCTQAPS